MNGFGFVKGVDWFALTLLLGSAAVQATDGQSSAGNHASDPPAIDAALSTLQQSPEPIRFEPRPVPTIAESTYFAYYGLDTSSGEHYFGKFRSGRHVLAAHAFVPEVPRATVIFMHGFYDHVGTFASTIGHLLELELAVVTYDQPGHGLSSGPRARIKSFTVYMSVFDDFLRLVHEHMPPPYHVLAHSTGAAIVVDRLLTHKGTEFERVVLVAPLVRSAYWGLSKTLSPVVDVFVDDVPRVFRDNTSDERFLEFVRQDPLQSRRTSLAWFDTLVAWNETIDRYPPSPQPIVIIQGDADSVVDWEYNLKFLEGKFPNARVETIGSGRHQLLNEAPALRGRVLQIVDEVLTQ